MKELLKLVHICESSGIICVPHFLRHSVVTIFYSTSFGDTKHHSHSHPVSSSTLVIRSSFTMFNAFLQCTHIYTANTTRDVQNAQLSTAIKLKWHPQTVASQSLLMITLETGNTSKIKQREVTLLQVVHCFPWSSVQQHCSLLPQTAIKSVFYCNQYSLSHNKQTEAVGNYKLKTLL